MRYRSPALNPIAVQETAEVPGSLEWNRTGPGRASPAGLLKDLPD